MKYFQFVLLNVLLIYSCKDNEPGNQLPQVNFSYSDSIDYFYLIDSSFDADGDKLEYSWSLACDTINLVKPDSQITSFELPYLALEKQLAITHTVDDGTESNSITKSITLPQTTLERYYGLGIILESGQSNDVDYEWYIDQKNTGTYSLINCGPTSVTMAIKWANPDFTKTPEDARNTYRSSGGWWYTDDIVNYLNLYSINNCIIKLNYISSIKDQIDLGNVAILCLDMYYIRFQQKSKWHIDKFYSTSSTGWGHFIVVKGYKIVDNTTYYEIYDPNSLGRAYDNKALKGKDRYYTSKDLNQATNVWWDYAIIVSKKELKSCGLEVDVNEIEHKPGM